MFRPSDDLPERPESAAPESQEGTRKFAPVPLGVFSGMLALGAEFFGLFLLAWGMAPTSIGCGAGRAASMTGAMLVISLSIFAIVAAIGIGIMREARESQLRRRSYLLTFGAIYLLGSLPLLALAPLFGSCFDF
jgi:uncharacterized membrane protein